MGVEAYFVSGMQLVTCRVVNDEPILADDMHMRLLRHVLNQVKQKQPFQTLAYVFLPTHMHLLLTRGQDVTLDRILHSMRQQFHRGHNELMGVPRKTRVLIWPHRYQAESIPDATTFTQALDFIHYNPVQHGLVDRPEEWLHSSYQTWIERRVYKLGWGWEMPESVKNCKWER